jgi:hypothetical protein
LVEAIGYNFVYQTFRVSLPRLISLFKVLVRQDYTSAIHLIQFTIPSTGKTTTMLKLKNVFNIGIVSGAPSLAKLIYNATTQEYGLVFTRDYVVIDEFDKTYDVFVQGENKNALGALSIGMGSGVWPREKYTREDITKIYRYTTLIFFGNIAGKLLKEVGNYREYMFKFLTQKWDEGMVEAFLDRVAIIDLYDGDRVNAYLHEKIPNASILKGIFTLLEKKAREIATNEKRTFGLSGRRDVQALQVYSVLRALGVNESLAEDFAKYLVLGDKQVEKYYKELYKEITGKDAEEIVEL